MSTSAVDAAPTGTPSSGAGQAVDPVGSAAARSCPPVPVDPAEVGATRPVGRPRDPRVDAAIVSATLQLLADGGYTALTMEAVAAMAGVGKAALYRRYPGKEQLVVDAVATLVEPPELVQGASVRDELVTRLDALRRRSDSVAGQLFPRLLSASMDNPELMHAYDRQVIQPRRAAFRAALQRGVDQGLVRPDVDLDHAVDLVVGPMAYRNLVRSAAPPGPDLAARIVDDILVALAPRPAAAPAPVLADPSRLRPAPQEDLA